MLYTKEFIKSLPKAELHCHLDGSLRPETIIALANKHKVDIPSQNPKELKELISVGERCENLEEYIACFGTTISVMQTKDALEIITYQLGEDAAEENVKALEIRFCPALHTNKGMSLKEVVDSVLIGAMHAENDFDIQIGVIVCGVRNMTPELSLELAKLTVQYKNKGVVGFDLAGPEENYPAKDHKEAFFHIINNNINTTVHAGEAYGAESIHQAIHYTRANRIGHGTRLRGDVELMEFVRNQRIPLEMCVTCNVQTQCVKDLDDHPVKDYLQSGIRVTINTDNRLISNTSLTEEYFKIANHFELTKAQLRKLIMNGFKSLFIPYEERIKLLQEIGQQLNKLGLKYKENES